MATSRPILAGTAPILIDVRIRGADRVIARLNKIMANIPLEMNKGSENLMRTAQAIARQEIRTKTQGKGALAAGIRIDKTETKQGKGNTTTAWKLDVDPAVSRYAGAVHDGFTGHWVHKDMLGAWLDRHPNVKLRNGKWLEVGYPKKYGGTSATWLQEGGVKYFDKAYAEILRLTQQEYNQRVQKLLRGK
ncbi:MAG: hypothetical protein Q8O88_01365 [bacterium]|nr:hypothetical protein [bacterium]